MWGFECEMVLHQTESGIGTDEVLRLTQKSKE